MSAATKTLVHFVARMLAEQYSLQYHQLSILQINLRVQVNRLVQASGSKVKETAVRAVQGVILRKGMEGEEPATEELKKICVAMKVSCYSITLGLNCVAHARKTAAERI